ncbi:MAG: hypothetical protein J6S26_01210 [Solobacterium sp.]|nr:hypothetical protein [Solobacterium sp.]
MKYVFVLPFLALGVFVSAFLYTSSGNPVMRYIGIGFGMILFAVMIFYYKEKFSVSHQLKQVPNAQEFEDAVMIGQAFFLEERMLGYAKGTVYCLSYPGIQKIEYSVTPRGKQYLNLTSEKGVLPVEMALKDQAARVAQFLKNRNPDAVVSGIDPSGPGTLHSIDPYRNEK